MTSFNLNYLLKALSPNILTLGVRASRYKFWGGHNSAPSVMPQDSMYITLGRI